jgi:soluble lytic murein transglycosylase-like protein
MADLDKFVLQYTVELKDSIQRLEKLQTKMNDVDKSGSKAGKGLKDFATGAAKELDQMVPGLSKVAGAVKGLGAEFAVAAAAVGALAIGVKSVMDLQSQFNAQRAAGMQLGVSGLRIENYQRAFANGSGGMVSRDAALEGVKRLSQMSNDAFTDPSGVKRFQMKQFLGIDPGSYDKPTGLNDEMRQIASSLQGKSADQVKGIAKATGFSQDWLLTLQKLGPAIGDINQLTTTEITNRQTAEDSLAKFNDELGKFKENINELEISLGEKLLPAAEKFVSLITMMVTAFNRATTPNAPTPGKIVNGHFVPDQPASSAPASTGKGHFGPGHLWIPDAPTPAQKQAETKQVEDKKKEQAKANAIVDKMDESNKTGLQTANQTTLAMNLFSASVASFAQAVDIHAAWAAWAGNIGQANGIKGSSGSSGPSNMTTGGGGNGNWKNSQYSGQIQAAAQAYGLDPQMLYAIMMTESHGVNGKYSETGAGGLMQVTKGNWRAYGGGANVMDTGANIMVGARIYAESLKRAGGDVNKGLGYYNGNSDPNYQAKVAGNYGGSSAGIGQSRSTLMLTQVQNAVAGALGIPVRQLQQGRAGRGDVQYTIDNLEAGYLNGANQAQMRLQNPIGLSQIQIADFKNQLLVAQRGLAAMETYKKQIIDGANGNGTLTAQRIGGTMAPISMTVDFHITGNVDAKTLAKEIDDRLQHHMQNAVNSVTNQEKG